VPAAVASLVAGGFVATTGLSTTPATATPAGAGGCQPAVVQLSGQPDLDITRCTGKSTHGNGKWIVEEPAGYAHSSGGTAATRTLLLWSHGFRPAYATGTGAHAAPDYPTGSIPSQGSTPGYGDVTHYALLQQGYALAGSAYGRNGWAVNDGVKADVELLKTIAPAHLSKQPKTVYAWGESLGGLITQMLAQDHASLIDAAFPQCGVLAGSNAIADKFLDAEVAAKAFFDPKLKLKNYTSDKQAANQFADVENAISSGLTSSDPSVQIKTYGTLVGLDALLGLPFKTFTFNDKHSQASRTFAAFESFVTQVGYGIQGGRDVVQRTGGLPVSNTGVDYRKLATPAAKAAAEAEGVSGKQVTAFAKTLQADAKRVAGSRQARKAFAGMGTPTGAVRVPTLTLHTEYDPLVLVQHETVFAQRVKAHHDAKRVRQIFIAPPNNSKWGFDSTTPQSGEIPAWYGAGHCNFSPAQLIAGIKYLDLWRAYDSRPSKSVFKSLTEAVAQQLSGLPGNPAKGVDNSYAEQPWPRPKL
jgi:hypothetical protein